MESGGNTSLCRSEAGLPVELCGREWDLFFFFHRVEGILSENEIAVQLEVTV